MPQDANGTEIEVGDVVTCRFRVTNIIADAQTLNLLCAHFKGHDGLPDDFRITLESGQVDIYQDAVLPEGTKRGKRETEEHGRADKKHDRETTEPEGKHEREHSAGEKEHANKGHEPEGKHEREHSAGEKEHAKKGH
jgi:hypothetical protein